MDYTVTEFVSETVSAFTQSISIIKKLFVPSILSTPHRSCVTSSSATYLFNESSRFCTLCPQSVWLTLISTNFPVSLNVKRFHALNWIRYCRVIVRPTENENHSVSYHSSHERNRDKVEITIFLFKETQIKIYFVRIKEVQFLHLYTEFISKPNFYASIS